MSFFMPQQLLASALEKIINQVLAMNSQHKPHNNTSFTALTALNGKTLTVVLTELTFPLCFSVVGEKLLVHGNTHGNSADITQNIPLHYCQINTSLKTLWQLKQEQQLTQLIKQNQLDVQGDLKIAQHFAALFENINIDWQSELANHIGDIPTYQLAQFFDVIKNKVNFAASQISADSTEWLLHEKKLVVTNYELNQFNQSVNHTVEQLAQLNKKIDLLTQKISASLHHS